MRTSPEMPHRRQKSRARKQSLLGSQFVYIGVLSDDFAAVDVREELCYHSRPKKQIQEVHGTGIKPMKESIARRKKRQPIPKRVSGDGSAPPRFRFGFPCCSCCLFRGVCLAAAPERASARVTVRRQPHRQLCRRLVIDKHTPWCQLNKFCGLKQNDNYLKNFNYSF